MRPCTGNRKGLYRKYPAPAGEFLCRRKLSKLTKREDSCALPLPFLSLQKRPDSIFHPAGILRHIPEPADRKSHFGIEDALLSPLAADGKAILLHPDKITVTAFPVCDLTGNGLLYPAFRQKPLPVKAAAGPINLADAGKLSDSQLHAGCAVKTALRVGLEHRVFLFPAV